MKRTPKIGKVSKRTPRGKNMLVAMERETSEELVEMQTAKRGPRRVEFWKDIF